MVKKIQPWLCFKNSPIRNIVIIDAPHFYAAIILENDICIETAPILSWSKGKNWGFLQAYFTKKGWTYLIKQIYSPSS